MNGIYISLAHPRDTVKRGFANASAHSSVASAAEVDFCVKRTGSGRFKKGSSG